MPGLESQPKAPLINHWLSRMSSIVLVEKHVAQFEEEGAWLRARIRVCNQQFLQERTWCRRLALNVKSGFHGFSKPLCVFLFLHSHFKRSSATSTSAFPATKYLAPFISECSPWHLRRGSVANTPTAATPPAITSKYLGSSPSGMTQTEQVHRLHRTQMMPMTVNIRQSMIQSSSPRRQKT